MNPKSFFKSILLNIGALIYRDNSSKVIYYHDIHSDKSHTDMSTPLSLFERHVIEARELGYRFVPQIENDSKELEITFDDGFRGLYENFSFFLDRRIPVRVFIVSDFVGKKDYLAEKEILEMVETGLLQVGSHTKTHRNLDTLTPSETAKELSDSKKRLEDLLGSRIDTVCFPRGRFNDTVIEESKKAGYEKMYSCLPGPYREQPFPGVVHRSLVQHATPSDFRSVLKGGDRIYKKRYLAMHYRNGNAS